MADLQKVSVGKASILRARLTSQTHRGRLRKMTHLHFTVTLISAQITNAAAQRRNFICKKAFLLLRGIQAPDRSFHPF